MTSKLRAHALTLPSLLAVLTFLVTGCPHNEYVVTLKPKGGEIERTLVFYSADGVNSNGVPGYHAFNTNEFAMIAALYTGQRVTNGAGPHQVSGEFTNALPDDVGGAGNYTNLVTSLGEAGFYVERFRGSDDLAGITERHERAADQITSQLLGWSRMALRREKGYGQLRHFLDVDFRQDLKNAGEYWCQARFASGYNTNSDQEFMVRFGQYLFARGYFTVGELPALYTALANNDTQPLRLHIQRLVARKMGVADTEPIPAALAFLADETNVEASFDKYLATTDSVRARLQEWERDSKQDPGLEKPKPEEIATETFSALIDFDLFDEPDHLTVRLALPTPPLHTNGRWDASLRHVVWDTAVGNRNKANALPFTCYAFWAQADETFQTEHFGKVALKGDALTQYCLWRASKDSQHGHEWDAFVAGLHPGAELTSQLDAFHFPSDPPSRTNSDAGAAIWPCQLIKAGLP